MEEDLIKNFYVENVEAWKRHILNCKKFSDRKLEVKIIEDGIVLPALKNRKLSYVGGVCDKNFNFVAGFTRTVPYEKIKAGTDWTCESAYTVDRKELIQLDEDVIFCGSVMGHFGHFMLECLSRLWFVLQNPKLKSKILFILIATIEPKPYFDEFFKLTGIDKERIIYVKQPLQCRSIMIPEQSQYNQWRTIKYTKEFFLPYQAVKSRIKPGKSKKIYLTRSKFDALNASKSRHCFNEEYFDDFFATHGFEVIAPEELSLKEQISLVMGADEIAATLGTLTHWAMFCKPGTKFIMLNRTNKMLPVQISINELFNVENYYIIDCSKNFMYAKHDFGVFLLGSNRYWKNFVKNYFGEQINEDDDAPYLESVLDKYLNFWCKKYSTKNHSDLYVSSLKTLCNRIITLEKKVNAPYLESVLDKYLEFWCKEYSTKNHLDLYVSSFRTLCNRIIALEKKLEYTRPLLIYQTHIANKGWGGCIVENHFSNVPDQKLDIQAIKINFTEPFHEVYYSVYYNDKEGWSKEVSNSQQAGTTGKSKPITGIKIRLDEAGAKDFDILYRVHKFDGTWTPWVKNGEELLSSGVKLNSIQIKLADKSKAHLTTSSMS